MGFWDFYNKAKNVVGNIYEGAKRVGNVLSTFGKAGYNIGRGIYDYVADNPFNMSNYYSFVNTAPEPTPRREPIKVPLRPPVNILPQPIRKLPPPSRQNEPRTRSESADAYASPYLGNPSEFWQTPSREPTQPSNVADFLRGAQPRPMRLGGLINNRQKLKYVL